MNLDNQQISADNGFGEGMKRIKLSELQSELRARGIPELSEKLKKQRGYDPVARKLRRNPAEIEAARRVQRAK